jgi:hypothetical protein
LKDKIKLLFIKLKMKENFVIILLLLKLIISSDYYLSLESITSFNAKYDLDIKNMKEDLINNKMSYTSIIEDYEKILNDAKDNYLNIKEENHPLVSITDSCSFELNIFQRKLYLLLIQDVLQMIFI